MMNDFDTSGVVLVKRPPENEFWDGVNWSDLSPFEQGYVRALFESRTELGYLVSDFGGFSILHPDALNMIRRDCAEFGLQFYPGHSQLLTEEDGRAFWNKRQIGHFRLAYPPLLIKLSDDGQSPSSKSVDLQPLTTKEQDRG